MNDMISIETGNLGPLYQCCATNAAANATQQDTRVRFSDAQQRRLIPVTALTPVPMPNVIQILEAKRMDTLRQMQQQRNGGGGGGGFAPTSSINSAFHDPRLRRAPEIAAGVGAAGTITAANDEIAVQHLMEKTKAYAATIVDGCAAAADYGRLLSTRISKSANANEAMLTAAASSSPQQQMLSQLGGSGAAGPAVPGSFAHIQLRFGADIDLLTIDEARLNMFSSIGMLSPQEKATIINQQRIAQLEAGGGVDVGTDLSIFTGVANPHDSASRRTLLKPFEAYMLATLMPATLEEALAYVPTLAAYEPFTIEAVLKGLRMGGV